MRLIFFLVLILPFSLVGQHVGIGTTTPTGPLSFPSTTGNKIVLWGDGGTAHYGIGIQGGLLQIYANQIVDGVAIGYGRSTAFVERFRVQGNGNIGIGTSSPAVRLDIAGSDGWNLTEGEGDMRIGNASNRLKFGVALSGSGVGAAGIMQQGGVGALSLGAAGKYLLQIAGASNYIDLQNITGGLRINNNAGTPGQVLTSGGPNALPYWSNPVTPGNAGFFNVATQTSTSADLLYGGQPVELPGCVVNFTLTTLSRVVFNYSARVWNKGCAFCGERRALLTLQKTAPGGTENWHDLGVYVPDTQYADGNSGPVSFDLAPGTYSFRIVLISSVYGTATTNATNGRFSWQIYPL